MKTADSPLESDTRSAPSIQQLPPSVINKIAAGEVIERPASVVKELMENSVDSGATRVEVSIEKGGSESIQVSDNGCGIRREELELAVASHATSKIRDAEDLFDVHTLGFRGEALASIAEISQFTLKSRAADSEHGFQLSVTGGKQEGIEPVATPVGTTISVEQLFFNTPVRRKFLKTVQTEMSHISEAFTRIALVHNQVHFTLRHNQKVVHDLPATDNWVQRIGDFFGQDIQEALIPIDSETGDIRLSGYVVNPTHSRGHNRMQYLFLNGRHIRDRSLQHALSESYRGLLLTGRFPIAFLKLDMPTDRVDVNVHPCKLEVRFQDGGRLYSQLLGSVRNKFLTTDLTARQNLDSRHAVPNSSAIQSPPLPPVQENLGLQTDRPSVNWTGRDSSATEQGFGSGNPVAGSPLPGQFGAPNSGPISPVPEMPRPSPARGSATDPWHAQVDQDIHDQLASGSGAGHDENHDGPTSVPGGMQIHNRYLIAQCEEGIEVIDQHALHERIIYEQLRDKVLNSKVESQRLLVPEPVNLAPAEASIIMESQSELARIGIDVESFGGDTIAVHAYPAMLNRHNPAEMLRAVVELLMETRRELEQRDIIDELLHMISCKAAVKAGDKLSPEEITAMLQHRELCQDAHHCPHGRPTSLVFSREELDKRFKRI